MHGIELAATEFGFEKPQIRTLMHGTTIATNAVLERRLPRGALVTLLQSAGDGSLVGTKHVADIQI